MIEIVISLISKFADELFGNSDLPAHYKWIILGGLFMFIELIHRSWMIIWFTIGALAATIVALFLPSENLIQIGTFFLVTGVSFGLYIILKPPTDLPDDPQIKEGRKVLCTNAIDSDIHSVGLIRIDGVEYKARLTDDSEPVKEGQWLRIKGWDDKDNLIVLVQPLVKDRVTEEV